LLCHYPRYIRATFSLLGRSGYGLSSSHGYLYLRMYRRPSDSSLQLRSGKRKFFKVRFIILYFRPLYVLSPFIHSESIANIARLRLSVCHRSFGQPVQLAQGRQKFWLRRSLFPHLHDYIS